MSSYLFVPGSQPERFEKAFATGVDHVIIDLEDAVDASKKEEARNHLIHFAQTHPTLSFAVRISSCSRATQDYVLDVQTLLQVQSLNHAANISQVLLTKVETASEIEGLYEKLGVPVLAFIETVSGWRNLSNLGKAKGLYAFTFGQLDLANELGIHPGSNAADIVMNRLRTDILLETRMNGLNGPIDTIYPSFEDDEGLAKVIKHWKNFGFSGMLCIHPRQVEVVREMCVPSESELAFAKEVCAKYSETGLAAFQVRGRMVDLPVIERCRRLLEQYDLIT
ncbi:HpcH/HpaI aldolase/citrate lyase family protein [Basilea psittacipulmonis]|uniref:HpcH/HpaI aldolase/citrate lyase domain-containing protein n=1 Tax=Basilea psittacipulmonis DSM 24701 TaxID=1072685 RepID=A0A077DG84_9BURK|nr:CoA ester lyase [Basilea psittacipulmonis]AIL32168.1 hypothetical protein IX83_01500 [Basilea psittacipulmonis DSM 24701]